VGGASGEGGVGQEAVEQLLGGGGDAGFGLEAVALAQLPGGGVEQAHGGVLVHRVELHAFEAFSEAGQQPVGGVEFGGGGFDDKFDFSA